MAKLVHSKCPNCGAAIDVDPAASSATCSYCGQVARVQRKTIFGRAAVPLDVAAGAPKVIHVPNAVGPIVVVFVLLVTFSIIGVVVYTVVKQINEAQRHVARVSNNPFKVDPSGKGYEMTVKNGDTIITIKDGKVVANLSGKAGAALALLNGRALFEQPMMAKAKLLEAADPSAQVASFTLYNDSASLEVLDGAQMRRYHMRNGKVSERKARRVSKSRLRRVKTFSLAKLDLDPVKDMVAKARAALSGNGVEVTHLVLEKDQHGKLEWRAYARSSTDRKIVRFDEQGKAIDP